MAERVANMTVDIRGLTARIAEAVEGAPPLTESDSSMFETVLAYVESGDSDSAKAYAETMTLPGLLRAYRNVCVTAGLLLSLALKQRMRDNLKTK